MLCPLMSPRPSTPPRMVLWLLLLRHMGFPEELIYLFHTLSRGSTMRIVKAHGPGPKHPPPSRPETR